MKRIIPLLVLVALPAQAGVVSETFRDVTSGHWAESAIEQVAIKRTLMQGFPDFTFRGETAYSRSQFAQALQGLIWELEAISKVSWKEAIAKPHKFTDADSTILSLANNYGLFEGLSLGSTFDGDKVLTRYEMAKVINNLMSLAERKGVVAVPPLSPRNPYSDLEQSAPFYHEVLAVTERYRVMVGYPDNTFRGSQELTRFEFAATCAQTFPLIRELVQKEIERKENPLAAARKGVILGLRSGMNSNGFVGSLDAAGYLYEPLFLNGRARLSTAGPVDLTVGGFYPMPKFGGVQIQPSVGVRYLTPTNVGLNAGLWASVPVDKNWGLYGNFDYGIMPNVLLRRGDVGAEFAVAPNWKLMAGVGFWEAPGVGTWDFALGVHF